MECPRCRRENPSGTKFCGGCGAPVELRCPTCHTFNPPMNAFCQECGRSLTATSAPSKSASPSTYTPRHLVEKILASRSTLEGERKLVTVLFCDIADSTILAERMGPEAMHRLLDQFFGLALEEVHRYEGTVNQFLGDGFMALFGAPVSHEDHASRALLTASALHKVLQERSSGFALPEGHRLAIRIGVNTGSVVVGTIGDNLRMDYTAIGDTTHLAARLQQLAEPGTILISEATRRLLRDEVRVEPLGPTHVKGKTEAIPVYKVVTIQPGRTVLDVAGERPLSPFVGRERQLGTLLELLGQVEGGHGHAVGLVGEPGVGKSRLLYEFRQHVRAKGFEYLEGRCLSYGSTIPYLPILNLVRRHCAITETDTPDEIAEKLSLGLESVGMDTEESRPYLLYLFGIDPGTDRLTTLNPEATKARTFAILKQMTISAVRHRRLVLAVEDLHWVDRTSEEFFASLLEGLPGAPILFFVTYRPGYRPSWLDKSYASQLSLAPISPDDALALVRSLLEQAPNSMHLAGLILAKAEGNPFFLEELSRELVEHGRVTDDASVPDTIQGVLMARIDRLPDATKRLLQTASVLGREVHLRLLEALGSGAALQPALQELTRLEFLYEQPGSGEPLYVFKHALTQEVAYGSLLTGRRNALHRAAGQALESLYARRLEEVYDRLAYHYARTDQADKAVHYLVRFAEKAARSHAHVEAVAALEEALVHAAKLPAAERDRRQLDIILRQANSFFLLGRLTQTIELLLQHGDQVERLDDATLSGPYYFRLGHTYSFLGNLPNAAHYLEQALDESKRCGDELTQGKTYTLLALQSFWSGRPAAGVEHGARSIALLSQAEELGWLGMSHWVVGLNQLLMGDIERALQAVGEARALGEAAGDRRLECYAAWVTGWAHGLRGEWEAAIVAGRNAIERSPSPVNTAIASGLLGHVQAERGNLAEAIPLLERAVQQLQQFRARHAESMFCGFLGEALLVEGQIDRAHELATRGLGGGEGFAYATAIARRLLGRVAQARGRLAEAQEHLTEAVCAFSAIPARYEVARTQLLLGELAHVQGTRDAAIAHFQEAYGLFTALRVPRFAEYTVTLAKHLGVEVAREVA